MVSVSSLPLPLPVLAVSVFVVVVVVVVPVVLLLPVDVAGHHHLPPHLPVHLGAQSGPEHRLLYCLLPANISLSWWINSDRYRTYSLSSYLVIDLILSSVDSAVGR